MKLELFISILVYSLLVNDDSYINCSRILRSNRRKISANRKHIKFLSNANVTNFNATNKAAFKKKIFPIIFCCPRYPQVVYASTASLATVPVVITAATASATATAATGASTGAATATARLVLTAQESKNKSAQQRAQRRRRRNRRRNRRNRNQSGTNGRKRRRQRRRRRRRRNRRVFNRDSTGLGNQRLANGDDVSLFDRLRLVFQRSSFGNLFRSRAMKGRRTAKIDVNEKQKNNSPKQQQRSSSHKSNHTRDKVNRKS